MITINQIPNVLYKFLRPQHAESMIRSGSVRIGTLFEFRALEDADRDRGDSGEGRLLLHSDASPRVYNSTDELPPVLQQMSFHCGLGGFATNNENAAALDFSSTNMLIYCTSEILEQAALGEWGGAAVRIPQPIRFFQALEEALQSEAARRGWRLGPLQLGSCSYIDRRHNWHRELPPQWLLKPARFQHQREFRAAWAVEGAGPLEALIVSSPGIAAACIPAAARLAEQPPG